MVENCIQRHLKVLISALTRGDQNAAEDLFGSSLVMRGDVDHRGTPITRRHPPHRRACLRKGPAGKNCSQTPYSSLIVSGDRRPARIQGQASIKVELVKANGKKLH